MSERSHTETVALELIESFEKHGEEEKALGVRLLRVHLNPNGFDEGWNSGRQWIFDELFGHEKRDPQKRGMWAFRLALMGYKPCPECGFLFKWDEVPHA